MSVDPAPKVFLQNKLSRCRGKLQELLPLLHEKRLFYLVSRFMCFYLFGLTEREVERLAKPFHAYDPNQSPDNIDEISEVWVFLVIWNKPCRLFFNKNFLEAFHQMTFFSTSKGIVETEIQTISAALGGELRRLIFGMKLIRTIDDEGAQQPHSFKSSSFSIPTQCGYCKVILTWAF